MKQRDIIAIGGSLGSMDVIKQLLGGLPKDLPVAVFVTVHVGDRGLNALASILDASSHIPVETAVDGEPVQRGRAYVAPADRHLLVIQDVVRLGRGPRENMSRPAIDPLFRSVALNYGPRAIGVILSGMLSDGAAGLAALKRCGGLTIVQNPADASAPDMPLAALHALEVDYRAPAADLSPLLIRLVQEEAGTVASMPADIVLEVDIALGQPSDSRVIAKIADAVPLTCPDCGGSLSQLKNGSPLRFRCQVGHAFTAETLAAAQVGDVDEAMRVALRILNERAVLLEKMADDARRSRRDRLAPDYERRAQECRQYADTLRQAVLSVGSHSGEPTRSALALLR